MIANIKEKEIISAKFAKKNKMILSPNVLKVIKRDGINEEGQASMSKFTGNN